MITIQFSGNDLADIRKQALAAFGSEAPTAPAAPVASAAPTEAPKADAPKIDLVDVRKACIAYKDKHGQTALREALAKVGAKGLPDVPETRYAELMELVR